MSTTPATYDAIVEESIRTFEERRRVMLIVRDALREVHALNNLVPNISSMELALWRLSNKNGEGSVIFNDSAPLPRPTTPLEFARHERVREVLGVYADDVIRVVQTLEGSGVLDEEKSTLSVLTTKQKHSLENPSVPYDSDSDSEVGIDINELEFVAVPIPEWCNILERIRNVVMSKMSCDNMSCDNMSCDNMNSHVIVGSIWNVASRTNATDYNLFLQNKEVQEILGEELLRACLSAPETVENDE